MSLKNDVLIIAGPTASGKSNFALRLSKFLRAEIISADSIQVYKNLNIGSAKICKSEQAQCTHHLIDILEPTQTYSVALFKESAQKLIEQINNSGKLAIIVGGTGLYLKSLLYPLSFANLERDADFTQKMELLAREKGAEYLHHLLKELDPKESEKIEPNNIRRVIRAIEIAKYSSKSKSSLNDLASPYDFKIVALTAPREELYKKIDRRVDEMFEDGLEQEVRQLIEKFKLNKSSQSMQAIGYKEFFPYFDGEISLNQLKEKIKNNTHHYAKRQITWLKTMPNVEWVEIDKIDDAFDKIVKDYDKYRK